MSSPLPTIFHLGAENQVTGSCHLLRANGLNIMVDCGAAQGGDSVLPMKDWPILPSEVDYLFLTHAHIDHVGRVPEIVGQGFKGEIITTHPTKALMILQRSLRRIDWHKGGHQPLPTSTHTDPGPISR